MPFDAQQGGQSDEDVSCLAVALPSDGQRGPGLVPTRLLQRLCHQAVQTRPPQPGQPS